MLSLVGCNGQSASKPQVQSPENSKQVETDSSKPNYKVNDGEIADYLEYNFQNKSMYIAGLKVVEEFGTSNEATVSIKTDENVLTLDITKATGSVTGVLDGPNVSFKMDLATNKIISKKFEPAPNYKELGITEFAEHSEEIIELTDERMIEIGQHFKELIIEIEAN